jgi:hypothetical protein
VEIVYGLGWDVQRGAFVGVFPLVEAQRRDAAGEPYSMCVVVENRILAILDRHGWYTALWLFDEAGRRVFKADYRELKPNRLMLCHVEQWQYHHDGEREGDPTVGRLTLSIDMTQQLAWGSHSPNGVNDYSSGLSRAIDLDRLWQAKPTLSADPTTLLPTIPIECLHTELLGRWGQPPTPQHEHLQVLSTAATEAPVDPQILAARVNHAPASPPWRIPSPYPPAGFEAWFTDGASVTFEGRDSHGRLRVVSAGMLRMPTGRWMATEPGWSTERFEPFTVTVPPGAYPVRLVFVEWDNGYQDGAAAMRLDITESRATTWEMALREGQDWRMLDDGGFYGFGVDGGMASLLDEAAFPVIQALSQDDVDFEEAYGWASSPGWADLTLPDVDANVIAATTALGDGAYPTWIGRTSTGEIASLVVDLEQLRSATIQPQGKHHSLGSASSGTGGLCRGCSGAPANRPNRQAGDRGVV